MIPERDYYADKEGKLTDDPEKYARQIGVKGCFLDEGTAKRYGISDTLVSTGEPSARRMVRTVIETKPEDNSPEPEAEEPKPAATHVAKKEADKGAKKIK
jgi:hypothetical protein